VSGDKKKNFGLAAQLARPRTNLGESADHKAPERSERLEHLERKGRSERAGGSQPLERPETLPCVTEPAVAQDMLDDSTRAPAAGRRGGAPRREGGIERMNLVLAPEIMMFVQERWRTFRRPDGTYVRGPSAYIEELIRRDREGDATP